MEIGCPRCGGKLVVPGQAPTPIPPPPTVSAATTVCPGCGGVLARGAVVCTQCGYNLATGQRLQSKTVAGKPAARPKSPGQDSWASNPNVLAVALLVIFGGLYLWGRTSQTGAMAFVGIQAIYGLGVGIYTLVLAFRESVGTGFMTLCIPCYSLYFVYGMSENPVLKALFGVSILTGAASGTLKGSLE
jgi:hypothetical protein